MFTCKPDYEQARDRTDIFWARADTDRPLVRISFGKPNAAGFPGKSYATLEERWLDVQYRSEQMAHWVRNTVFYADAMPVAFPNLGPEILSAWAGCPYHYGESTTWTDPCIFDWERDAHKAVVDWNHPLFKKLEEFTKCLIELGRGNFIAGLTDFHPGGDHVAALRDPQVLATDLIDYPDQVKAKLASSYLEYYPAIDHFTKMIKDAGMPISSWTDITSERTMYIPSNDFSCMVSEAMFAEFFLEGIKDECRHFGNTIYHLDGPDALRHLDALLAIPELDAIQWVPGAGNEGVGHWMDVYKKISKAGKALQVTSVHPNDLPMLMENLPANGLWLCMYGINNESEAEDVMKTIGRWGRK